MLLPNMAAKNSAALDLRSHGFHNTGPVYANLAPARLVELALSRGEGILTADGALTAATGARTGRSPKDKYFVREPASHEEIWWGPNRPLEPAVFDRLLAKVLAYYQGRPTFVHDGTACASPYYRLRVRLVAEKAWHAQFMQCLLLPPTDAERADFIPDLTIINACGLLADPAIDGTSSEVFVAVSLERKLVLIGGTQYAGEMKKAVFTVLNYLLPKQGVFPMHCAANVGPGGDVALFFGLSGTGKTTLSADPERRLIGDDEHAWSSAGVFNLEGGCYAKTIRLSQQGEPQIWKALRFGSVLENVIVDAETRLPDFDNDRLTENTRAAYPIDHIANREVSGQGTHPRNVVFLTCDAFGVLPPLSRLTPEQALYHFLSGYTAKVAGTETGVQGAQATFSTCFAAPFLPLQPTVYARLLDDRLRTHQPAVWWVNTGWTGGPYGQGTRMALAHTRTMLRAALHGELEDVPTVPDSVFGVAVPTHCPGVPRELLQPRTTWPDANAYDAQLRQLAGLFQTNFQTHAALASAAVKDAGPRI
jgi:phosphoenolpyruvate carboxykinase (ATP)